MGSRWVPPPIFNPILDRSLSKRIYEEVCAKWTKVSGERIAAELAAHRRANGQNGPDPQLLFSARFAVIGSFVVVNTETDTIRVLSIGTGTKWTRESNRKRDTGQDLVDSHAEIIARRALVALLFEMVRYCKKEGHVVSDANDWCLLQKVDKNHYRLKPNLQLYLYVNIPPCENKGPTKKVHPVTLKAYDDYTNASSCSEKVQKWTICGVQGALLSQFIEPIYLRGLVVSEGWGVQYENFDEEEDKILREIWSRIRTDAYVSDPELRARGFQAHEPKVGRYFPDDSALFPDFFSKNVTDTPRSHNWFDSPTGRQIELTHSTAGMVLHQGDKVERDESRLSKRNFAERYLQLGDIIDIVEEYKVLKATCTMFNAAKRMINYPRAPPSDQKFRTVATARDFKSFSRPSRGRGGSGADAGR